MNLRIKEVCKEKGITITQLAKKLNIKQESLSRAINGNPTIETLNKIAAALNVPISDLFTQPKENTVNCPYCGNRIKLIQDGGNFTDKPKPRPVVNTGVPPTPPTKAPEQSTAKDEDTPADNEPAP